jgi:hypothetical protein
LHINTYMHILYVSCVMLCFSETVVKIRLHTSMYMQYMLIPKYKPDMHHARIYILERKSIPIHHHFSFVGFDVHQRAQGSSPMGLPELQRTPLLQADATRAKQRPLQQADRAKQTQAASASTSQPGQPAWGQSLSV